MVVMLMVFHTCGELLPWGVGPILMSKYRIYGKDYAALLQGVFCVELLKGSPSVARFPLQEFGIEYLMLKCVAIENTSMA